MKRIITLLLIILVSNPVIGQITKQNKQEFEKLTTSKIFKPDKQHKRFKHFQTPNSRFNTNTSKFAKSRADNKTLDSLITQEWDDNTNDWEFSTRQQFTYDAYDNLDEAILSLWSNNTSSWQVFQKNEFSFDANGNLTEQLIYYSYVPGSPWVLSEKSEFTYDGNNNLILEEDFNYYNDAWVNTYKYELSYDMNQNLILDIGYEWYSNQWYNSYMDEYFYTNNALTSVVYSLWNYSDTQWDYDSKEIYAYSAGQLITEVIQQWDTVLSDWVDGYRTEYTYNLDGSLDYETYQIYDENLDAWNNWYKDDYQYDSNGNRTIGLYSEWLGNPAEWVEYEKDEYVFDLNYNFSDLNIPFYYTYMLAGENLDPNNMVIGYLEFDKENQLWVNSDRMLFHYSDYSNPLNVPNRALANTLMVYPNPASDILVVDSNIPLVKAEMYSLLGKKVKEVYTDFKAIPINNLSEGIYIIKIQSENGIILKKVIKN